MIVKTPVDQIAVNLFCVVYIGLGNQNQNIEFNPVALEEVDTSQNSRMGRPASCGPSVAIVHLRRTVEAAADEKPIAIGAATIISTKSEKVSPKTEAYKAIFSAFSP